MKNTVFASTRLNYLGHDTTKKCFLQYYDPERDKISGFLVRNL